jgi:hypothetical protein
MLIIINILIRILNHYKISVRETVLAPNTSTFLQTTSAAEAHLAEGQIFFEGQTLNEVISLIYRAGGQRPATKTIMMMMMMIIIIIITIQFYIIYVSSQQLHGQLQTQHSADTGNYITDKHNIKSKINYRQVLGKIHINAER